MKKVYQTKFGLPDGNCHAAALASIFGVELEDIPDFYDSDSHWYDEFVKFMVKRFGVQPIEVLNNGCGWQPIGLHLINGDSPRGDFKHAIVGESGKPIYDPFPGGNCELKSVDTYTIFAAIMRSGE